MKYNILGVFVLLFIGACSVDKAVELTPETKKSNTGSLRLVFEPYVDSLPLELYTKKYLSPANDTFEVQSFKFFVRLKSLNNSSTSKKWNVKYSLISFDSERTINSIEIDSIPFGTYTNLKFDIGVDSINNHTTVHLGELAPGSGMTWDWNTGYKFLLLEGNFSSIVKSGALVFHIGEDKNYKSLNFDIPGNLAITNNLATIVKIRVNINAMFANPNLIDFDVVSQAMQDEDADKIADNYAEGMFSIYQIVQPYDN